MDIRINGNKLESISLVILDKDGTITDLYSYWSKIIEMRARDICKKLDLSEKCFNELVYIMGIDKKRRKIKDGGPVGIKPRDYIIDLVCDYIGIYTETPRDLCETIFVNVDNKIKSILDSLIVPINGAKETIEYIDNTGCKIAIATSDRVGNTELIMRILGIEMMIDLIIGGDSIGNQKPDKEIVEFACNAMSIDKDDTVIVGDSISDIKCGVNANIRSIGVCSGVSKRHELLEYTPYVVDNISKMVIL